MKVLSKFKDYYDYLAGIYGIDNKLILDRTTFSPYIYGPLEGSVIRFAICDYIVEGVYHKGEYLYGEEIIPLSDKTRSSWWASSWREDYYFFKGTNARILKEPKLIPRDKSPNTDSPILISMRIGRDMLDKSQYDKNPILKDYKMSKVFPAEKIWLMLSEWLGREKVIVNNQTDKEKIISKGFDIKTSFRNM